MAIPLWLKIVYLAFVCGLVPIYWKQYGPANFLWFSDIALLLLVPALWLESKLLFSTLAVSVGLLELLWNADFLFRLLTGNEVVGLSAYMFDSRIKLWIRALSVFHVVLPPLILWYVYKLGYDGRGFAVQTVIAWAVLLVCYFFTPPSENVNWVYGFGKPQTLLPRGLYLALLMLGFPVVIYFPSHLILARLF